MITLEHFKVGNFDGCLTTANGEPIGIQEECYVRGWDKPNYAMPAIQGQCFIEEWCIDLCAADKNAEYPIIKTWYRS